MKITKENIKKLLKLPGGWLGAYFVPILIFYIFCGFDNSLLTNIKFYIWFVFAIPTSFGYIAIIFLFLGFIIGAGINSLVLTNSKRKKEKKLVFMH